jgi:translation initiation factor 2 subunit 1
MEGEEGTTSNHQASSPPAERVVAKCRMYEAEFPERDELVMIRVLAAEEEFYYRVALLEYNDREGIILRGELSGSRDRAMRASAQRVGKEEVARVVRVGQGRGYIDLSSLRPHAHDSAVECSKRYRKAKAEHCTMTHAAELLLQQRESENGLTLEQLYQRVGWPLYAKYGHAYDAFEKAATGEEDVFEGIADVPADIKHTLLHAIQRHPQPRPTAASATPFSRPDSPVGSSSTIIETHDT